MGTADMLLFAFLVLSNLVVFAFLSARRQRRVRAQRMARSLRFAIQRANCPDVVGVGCPEFVLPQAS